MNQSIFLGLDSQNHTCSAAPRTRHGSPASTSRDLSSAVSRSACAVTAKLSELPRWEMVSKTPLAMAWVVGGKTELRMRLETVNMTGDTKKTYKTRDAPCSVLCLRIFTGNDRAITINTLLLV